MDIIDLAPVNRAPAPHPVPDQRPTADAAALSRDPRPHVPLPVSAASIPARGLSQIAEVTKSALRADAAPVTDPSLPIDKRLTEVQRTLKPYGVSMLPDNRRGERAAAAEQRAQDAESAATRARAEATEARSTAQTKDAADAAKNAAIKADSATAAQTTRAAPAKAPDVAAPSASPEPQIRAAQNAAPNASPNDAD